MKSVAIFAPFSKIWQHSVAEARLALALKKLEYDVTVITCGNSFPLYSTPLEHYSFFFKLFKFIEINYPFSLKSLIQLRQLIDSESDHLYDLTQFNRA